MRFLCLLLLGGCSAAPYAELGLGYQVDAQTDYWVQTDREWQCSKQPQFHGELGLEFNNNWKIGYHHQSWVLCGGHNDTPEVYMDDIRITKKFGGK
jgi:hypothetical protein